MCCPSEFSGALEELDNWTVEKLFVRFFISQEAERTCLKNLPMGKQVAKFSGNKTSSAEREVVQTFHNFTLCRA